MAERVDPVLARAGKWQTEFEQLRSIVSGLGLTEEIKWGWPCYSLGDKNIVLMHGFKEYCALLFFQGALLKDPRNLLVQQTATVQAARQMRFTGLAEIRKLEPVIKQYLLEAIAVEKAGLKVPLKETAEFAVPAEFRALLDRDPALKAAFEALTPGRQRAYLLHFGQPKQSATRIARIDKNVPRILAGKGLND